MPDIIPSFYPLPRQPQSQADLLPWARDMTLAVQNALRPIADRTNAMIQQGAFGQRPAADGSRRFYWATDIRRLSYDPGSWVGIGGDFVFNVLDFGATGVGDDSAALQAAIDAADAAGGGTVLVPHSISFGSPLVLSNKKRVIISGPVGRTNDTTGVKLSYSGTTAPAIDVRCGAGQFSEGCGIRDLSLLYNNAGFTGNLIDLAGSGGGGTIYFSFSNVTVIGSVSTAAVLVNLKNTNQVYFYNCSFGNAAVGIKGKSVDADYPAVTAIENCDFRYGAFTTAPIKNAGTGWLIKACTFEAISGGVPTAYVNDAGVNSHAVTFISNWFGDSSAVGTLISIQGSGISVIGNHFEGSGASTFFKLSAASEGIAIVGNDNANSPSATAIDLGGFASVGILISGNHLAGVATALKGHTACTEISTPGNSPELQATSPAAYVEITDSSAIANTATLTTFNRSRTIPANTLKVGDVIKIWASGTYGTAAAAPTIDTRFRIAGWTIGGFVGQPLTGGLASTRSWSAEATFVVRAIGVGGSVIAGPGYIGFDGSNLAPTNVGSGVGPQAVDTTAAATVDLQAKWSVADASNTITMRTFTVAIFSAANTQ